MWVCSQLCPSLFDPQDCSLPGSSVHGILQESIPKWIPIPSARDLPDSGIEPASPAQAGRASTPVSWEAPTFMSKLIFPSNLFKDLSKINTISVC